MSVFGVVEDVFSKSALRKHMSLWMNWIVRFPSAIGIHPHRFCPSHQASIYHCLQLTFYVIIILIIYSLIFDSVWFSCHCFVIDCRFLFIPEGILHQSCMVLVRVKRDPKFILESVAGSIFHSCVISLPVSNSSTSEIDNSRQINDRKRIRWETTQNRLVSRRNGRNSKKKE